MTQEEFQCKTIMCYVVMRRERTRISEVSRDGTFITGDLNT